MNFKALLKSKRWNFATMARALGVSHPTVRNWYIKHGSPSPEQVRRMSDLLECTTDEVINALLENEQ
ncbi:MAG: helix-turn-helix domain-containing protein [Coriobacteriales bacterium]|jgi:DNA-binding helix-turn-helix protein|nr:MAG TPA: helix-turn-helix domain protein [Caudoviricetes sp.]